MQKKDAEDRYYINIPKNIISLKHKYSQYKNSLRIKAHVEKSNICDTDPLGNSVG